MTPDNVTTTIGLLLLGFLLGSVIVALAGQSRARRSEEAHKEQMRLLRDDAAKQHTDMTVTVESARLAQAGAEESLQQLDVRAREIDSDYTLLKAQFEEEQELAGGMEDRLNAAEARLLTVEAELARNLVDLQQWSAAYNQLKSAHNRLSSEHHEAQERQTTLEADLEIRRTELESLNVRLDALQNALESAQAARYDVLAPDSTDVLANVTAMAEAKAEVQAVLRQRELEMAEVRSQLAATRYSINVLTSSGAALAEMLTRAQRGEEDAQELSHLATAPTQRSARSGAASAEDFNDLQSMIADWFEEVRGTLPYSNALLLQFAGLSTSARFGEEPMTIEGIVDLIKSGQVVDEGGDGTEETTANTGTRFDSVVPLASVLPPSLMLAAIKASSTTAIERSVNRQYELANQLARTRADLDQLGVRIHAWRSMLTTTLADDPALAAQISDREYANTSELLTASATLALSAYQKQQDALQRALAQQAASAFAAESAAESAARSATESAASARAASSPLDPRAWLRRLRRATQSTHTD